MKIFIINLPESKARMEAMKAQLTKLSLDWEFLLAFDGRKMPDDVKENIYDSKIAVKKFGREMRNGEIGCAHSHRSVYRKMIAENISSAVILEDDVILYDCFEETIKTIEKEHFHNTLIKLENSIAGLRLSVWHNKKIGSNIILFISYIILISISF